MPKIGAGTVTTTKYGQPYAQMSRELAGGASLEYISPQGIASTGGMLGGRGGGGRTPIPTPTGGGAGGATAVTGGSEIMDLYAAALERLSTGGMALEASLADIEEGKRQAIGRGQQALVSGGLGGTTVMGGVPVAAEKAAGRARLAARGEAESKYLTTLASYAAFAQRAQEAAAGRSAAMERLQMQISSQERLTEQQISAPRGGGAYVPESERYTRAYTYGASLSPDIERTMVSGIGPTTASRYSSRFPSIYGEAEEAVPSLMAT